MVAFSTCATPYTTYWIGDNRQVKFFFLLRLSQLDKFWVTSMNWDTFVHRDYSIWSHLHVSQKAAIYNIKMSYFVQSRVSFIVMMIGDKLQNFVEKIAFEIACYSTRTKKSNFNDMTQFFSELCYLVNWFIRLKHSFHSQSHALTSPPFWFVSI